MSERMSIHVFDCTESRICQSSLGSDENNPTRFIREGSIVSGITRRRQLVAPDDGILCPRSGGATMMYGTRIPVTHLTLAWAGLTYIKGHSEPTFINHQHTRNHILHLTGS